METIETTITRMTRISNTASGGPRYQVDLDFNPLTSAVRFVTRDDCQDSYGWAPDQLIGKPVVIALDERHRIFGIDTVADIHAAGSI